MKNTSKYKNKKRSKKDILNVDANEAWIYENPKVICAIRQGLKDVKEGKATRIADQGKFFKSL